MAAAAAALARGARAAARCGAAPPLRGCCYWGPCPQTPQHLVAISTTSATGEADSVWCHAVPCVSSPLVLTAPCAVRGAPRASIAARGAADALCTAPCLHGQLGSPNVGQVGGQYHTISIIPSRLRTAACPANKGRTPPILSTTSKHDQSSSCFFSTATRGCSQRSPIPFSRQV